MKYRLLIPALIFVLLHCSNIVLSQSQSIDSDRVKESTQSEEVTVDSIVIRQNITISDDSIRDYKKRKEFAYIYNLDSFLQHSAKLKIDTINPDNFNRLKPAKNRRINKAKSISEPGPGIFDIGFVKIILWLLAIGFIVFILYKLFLGEAMFKKAPAKNKVVKKEEEVSLDPSGYNLLVNEAIQNKNFRLAIRYLYLEALQNLTQAGAIQFSPDKTNYEYVRELLNKSYQNEFASLTLNYEYVWYGRFDINEDLFGILRKEFNQFHQKIKY